MGMCPNCFQEIDSLDTMTIHFQPFHLDEQGQPVYDVVPPDYPWEEQASHQYFCPKCGTTLAMDEAAAINVLKNATAIPCSHCRHRSAVQGKRKAAGIISRSSSVK